MDEQQMIDAIRHRFDVVRIMDGVYVFNADDKFGTIKNYQQVEDHYEVMFDDLTPEQVVSLFVQRPATKQVSE